MMFGTEEKLLLGGLLALAIFGGWFVLGVDKRIQEKVVEVEKMVEVAEMEVEIKRSIIIDEANAQFDAKDAYIASLIEANKYEVVVGDKIYHAYFNDGNNQVRFLEKGVLE